MESITEDMTMTEDEWKKYWKVIKINNEDELKKFVNKMQNKFRKYKKQSSKQIKAGNEVNVKMNLDEYVEILKMLWNNIDLQDEVKQSLFPKLTEFIHEAGYDNIESPQKMIDNYINRADIHDKSEFEPDETYSTWEEYCSENALLWNDEYAIISF